MSPLKIKRNKESCIDCNLCAKACPSFIKVDKVNTVLSDECTTCLNCLDACPVKNTLEINLVASSKKVSKKLIVAAVAGIYFLIISIGMLTGNWENNIKKEEYLHLFEEKNSIGHIRSSDDIERLNKHAEVDNQ